MDLVYSTLQPRPPRRRHKTEAPSTTKDVKRIISLPVSLVLCFIHRGLEQRPVYRVQTPASNSKLGWQSRTSILASLNRRGPSLKAPYRRRILRSILLEGALKKRLDPVMHKFITKSKVKASRGSPGSPPEGGGGLIIFQ